MPALFQFWANPLKCVIDEFLTRAVFVLVEAAHTSCFGARVLVFLSGLPELETLVGTLCGVILCCEKEFSVTGFGFPSLCFPSGGRMGIGLVK